MTEEEEKVKNEAQSLRDTLRLIGPATSHTRKFRFVPSEKVREQAERLDQLVEQPKATPEAKRELQSGLELVEQVARGMKSPPPYPFVRRQPRPRAEAVKLGRKLEAQVKAHRETIDQMG